MTKEEAVIFLAKAIGPVNASDEELDELGLFNQSNIVQQLTDELADGEDKKWLEEVREAAAVLLR